MQKYNEHIIEEKKIPAELAPKGMRVNLISPGPVDASNLLIMGVQLKGLVHGPRDNRIGNEDD